VIYIPTREVNFFGDYSLRFNWSAFEKMTSALGASSFSDFDKIMTKLGPVEIRLIIWAGLQHKFPNIKKENVSDLIDEFMELNDNDMQALTELVMTALTEASVFSGRTDKGENQKEIKGSESKASKK
jgi:hypothetical protein